jgi:hypothetical protein
MTYLTYSNVVTVATVVVVILQLYNHYNLSNGNLKLAYKVAIVAYTLYAAIETSLALRDPEQISVMLFNIVNIWAIAMAAKGLFRLKKLEKEAASNTNFESSKA